MLSPAQLVIGTRAMQAVLAGDLPYSAKASGAYAFLELLLANDLLDILDRLPTGGDGPSAPG